eukprot:GHUV01001043.1.p1 GENE.GHUV01001043.1~~GHUV01001043.1.p1  ORF type:complete len:244 (+),score=49.76 GHUV01001043.1:126-857(+)
MASSTMYNAVAILACFMLVQTIHAATLPPATFNSDNIVEDINKDCPVKNVLFDKSVFNAESLMSMPDVLQNGGVSKECQDAAVNDLVYCFTDGSLQIMTGCCSTTCATAVKKNIASGCFAQYQTAICSEPKAASVQTGLFYAAKRCGNYAATCAGTTANTTATKANTTASASAANTTEVSNATSALPMTVTATGNRSAGSTSTTAAPASSTSSTTKSAAGSTAVSVALSLAAAVTAFVVVIVC